jgi:hypothetical protein
MSERRSWAHSGAFWLHPPATADSEKTHGESGTAHLPCVYPARGPLGVRRGVGFAPRLGWFSDVSEKHRPSDGLMGQSWPAEGIHNTAPIEAKIAANLN